MTVEELKAEAKKLGYTVLKSKQMPKFEMCTCGCSQHHRWTHDKRIMLECVRCHKRTPYCDGEYEARITWNEMIEKEILSQQ